MIDVIIVEQDAHVVDIVLLINHFLSNLKEPVTTEFAKTKRVRIAIGAFKRRVGKVRYRKFSVPVINILFVVDVEQSRTYIGIVIRSAAQYIGIDKGNC